ncbi:MAG TPA: DUF5916 domain-containing protein [Gemmatimonadales bacterium]|nr:DUF5916 domain-containing protein [Gemmatimonadales bacterium]
MGCHGLGRAKGAAAMLGLLLALPSAAAGQRMTYPASAGVPAIVASADSAAHAFAPNVRPTLAVRRAPGPIVVDGALDDPGWAGADVAANFAERFPRDNVLPPVRTEARVTYDSTHLYVAIVSWDDPRALRSTLTDRDQPYADDFVGLMLDTYGDAAWAYELFVNPRGVQIDLQMLGSGGEDEGFDLIWDAESKVLEDRWQVEIAIPFESLRFPKRPVHAWRINFWRNQPRDVRRQITWARISRDDPCFMCQWGTIEGIEGAVPGGALEVLPQLVAGQSGGVADPGDPASPFENGSFKAEAGLGVKYSFAGGLTAEGALNPDFSQIESDVPQIDVNTTFALFYPERRPFFQEGSELFETYITAVNTRQINDPYGVAKLVGRSGRSALAYLGGVDETTPILIPFEERSYVGVTGRSVSNIGRVRQTFGRQSYAGALFTDRRYDQGGYNTVAGADGALQFLGNFRLEGQLLGSWTTEPDDPEATAGLDGVTFADGAHTGTWDGESFNGHAGYLSLERDARTWSFNLDYYEASPTFRADNGFEFANAYRRFEGWTGLAFRPAKKFISEFRPDIYTQVEYNWDGDLKGVFVEPSVEFNLIGQTYVDLELSVERETFKGVTFRDMVQPQVFVQTRPSQMFQMSLFVGHGDDIYRSPAVPLPGTSTNVELGATLRPTGQVTLEPSLAYARMEGEGGETFFSGYIARTRLGLQFTRSFFLRLVGQYNDFEDAWSVEPLLTYRVNPFTLMYVGASQGWQGVPGDERYAKVSRQYFFKVQYLFRR